MRLNSNNSVILILLGLYPVAAVSSQSALDAIIILISFLWLFMIYKKGYHENRLSSTGAEIPLFSYFIVVILGFIFNASPEAPWLNSLVKFTWILNLYILIYAIRISNLNLNKILKFISICVLPPTIYSLVSYYHGVDLITGRENSRITGLVNSATYHAHGNAVIFVFMTSIYVFVRKRLSLNWQIFCGISLGLLGLSIFYTFTRGIWLSLTLSTFIMAFYYNWKKGLRVILVLAVIFANVYLSSEKVRGRFIPLTEDQSAIERLNLIKINFQMWKEYPLLGIGHGENLRRIQEYWNKSTWNMPKGYVLSHAHNQYVNVLSTTGILGFISFVWFFIFFLNKNFKLLRENSHVKDSAHYILLFSCFWCQIEFFIACLTDVTFEYAKIRALLILIWAVVIAVELKIKNEKNDVT
jgi:O-antigen ligase